jgi:hypothetical protein
MATLISLKTLTGDLWRMLGRGDDGALNQGQDELRAVAPTGTSADSDGLAAEQPEPPLFQPRFVPPPDGTEWS